LPPLTILSWEDRPVRSLLIGGLGACLGLAVAGYGLFTAPGTARGSLPPEDVALVNQRPILRGDYEALMQTRFGTSVTAAMPQQRRALLEDMLREELFVQRGLELDEPGNDPDTRAALVAAVQQQVAIDATSKIPPEAVLRDYYRAHLDQYSTVGVMTLHDLVPTQGAGLAVPIPAAAVEALRHGEPLAPVIARYGLRESGDAEGEQLYFAAKIHLGETLYAAALALSDGEGAEPVRTAQGWHLLVMQRNDRPRPRSFEDARSQVYNDYKSDLTAQMQQAEFRYLRNRAEIRVAPGIE
jgi:hypothetical protein